MTERNKQIFLIGLYLTAIILANLSSAHFGPSASIVNAFLFIGLDLTSRDKLHDLWRGHLLRNMAALIMAGSLISWVLNHGAGRIAIASMVAFAVAAVADAVVYHLLKEKSYLVRVNGSNVIGAALDSLIFPTIAFGGFMPLVTMGQFAAKVAGGFIWGWILKSRD